MEQKWKWPLGRLQTTVVVQVSTPYNYHKLLRGAFMKQQLITAVYLASNSNVSK